jgi:hypothetical protein
MTAAVSTANLTGQMVIAGSPLKVMGRRAIDICARTWRNTSPYGAQQLGRRGSCWAIGAR